MKLLASMYSEFNKQLQSKPWQSLPRIQMGLHTTAFLLGNDCPHMLLEDWVKLLCSSKLKTL